MIEMNPYYAHDSAVGPVFDAATWSPGKAYSTALFALIFGVAILAATALAWDPTLLLEKPPEWVASLHEEIVNLKKEYAWAAYGGAGAGLLVGFFALAGSCASLIAAVSGDYYFRVGPGGLSLRVPQGLDWTKFGLAFKKLELDLPMDQIAEWTVVQHKRLGSLSRNAGNIMAFFKIRKADGGREEFNLDGFREPSHVIHSKIQDALEMRPASLTPGDDFPMTIERV